jgi:acetolactate synthase I/II/III large subunit
VDARKNYPADSALIGDAKAVVADLTACLAGPLPRAGGDGRDAEGPRREALSRVREVNEAARAAVLAEEPRAALLLAALAEVGSRAVLVADMCVAGYWVGGFARLPGPRTLAYPVGWGTLGFAFPAALGVAATGRRAIVVCGDGGFLFACGELATAAQERLPVTVVLVDDGGYGMLRYDQETAGAAPFGVDLVSPDFCALAASFGVEAREVADFGETFRKTLAGFATDAGPNLIVVRSALTPPPNTSPRWYRRRPA